MKKNSKMQLASIIMPYYKKRLFIKKTIKSVLNQSFKNFELIIIYDDENKKDLELLKLIKRKDKRIKLIINKYNTGAGESRNRGIKISKGDYICFIDADDKWKKKKLEKQIQFMEKNNYMASHTSFEMINQKNQIFAFRQARSFKNYKELIKSCDIGLSTVILKKSILKKNIRFPKLKTKEDFVFWLKILKKGNIIHALDENLTTWTKTDNSLSSFAFQKLKDSYKLYNHYLKFNFFKSLYYTFVLSINYILKNL